MNLVVALSVISIVVVLFGSCLAMQGGFMKSWWTLMLCWVLGLRACRTVGAFGEFGGAGFLLFLGLRTLKSLEAPFPKYQESPNPTPV